MHCEKSWLTLTEYDIYLMILMKVFEIWNITPNQTLLLIITEGFVSAFRSPVSVQGLFI